MLRSHGAFPVAVSGVDRIWQKQQLTPMIRSRKEHFSKDCTGAYVGVLLVLEDGRVECISTPPSRQSDSRSVNITTRLSESD